MRIMTIAAGCLLCACGVDPVSTATVQQDGINMQGINMQGMNMVGFELGSGTLDGSQLDNLRVEQGQLVAEVGGVTLSGTSLVGAQLTAQAVSATDPSVTVEVAYQISAITPENAAAYDPTHTGSTYLYTLQQYVSDTNSWQPACGVDQDGLQVAIPVAAIFDAQGNRVESTTLFTFGCTTGVIAKCYRWGYRPWVTGYGDLVDMHWTCTRLARADYCGDGTPHTHDGTWVNVWDTLPPPGPIQKHGLLPPLGMLFEAGWNHSGAVCLSRARWLLDDTLANLCPDRLIPPGLLGATVCNTVADVLGYDPDAKLFNESYLNLDL